MLYRRAGMQDAGSRATARGARGARAGAPQASPYEKPPSKTLERTACSARSAIPHAVLALAQAEPCMQRACHYRTTSREPRLPPVTPLCPLTPAAAVTRTRVTMHDACNVYTITARPHVHVSHALTRAAPVLSRPQPLANQSCFRSVRARPCMQRACHSRTPSRERPSPSSPQPLAVPPARLTIAAGTATRVRVSTVRVSTIAAGAPTRHVMENEFDRTSSTARPTPPCPLPLVRRPGT